MGVLGAALQVRPVLERSKEGESAPVDLLDLWSPQDLLPPENSAEQKCR